MKSVVSPGLSITPRQLAAGVHATPPRLPPVPIPADNPRTAEKINFGTRCFATFTRHTPYFFDNGGRFNA
jgi:hypothetical protein